MANNIAIRLGVEGGPELKRVFDDAGSAGQAAFQKVGAAADQAAAATDRQTAKYQRLAQAAREAEAQARAQTNVNTLLGVGTSTAGSARDSASVFEAELARQDQIRAARQEQAARTSQANINTLLGVRDAQVGAARASASAFEEAYRAETDALRRTAEARTTIVRNTVSGWRDLGTAGAATLANIEAGRRLGSLGNVPEAANQNVARRLRSDEVTNLMYQGGDVAAQLGSGSPLGMIAMQQGPQIAQIFAGPGGASVKGALGQAGEAAAGFAARIGVVGAGIGGLVAATGLGIAALISYRNSQSEVEKTLAGVGRASGTTLAQINALAEGQAGSMSRRSAREIAATYAGTGRIDASLLPGAVSATPDFAKFLGVDRSDGATELAGALGDVSRGATDLAQRYGLLTDAQAESIRRMDAQGDRLGAQRRLLDTVRDSTRGLAEATTGWGRATEWLSNRWDDLGRVVDRAVTGGDLDTRLKTARDALAEALGEAEGANSYYRQAILDPRIAAFEQQVAELEKRVGARDAVSEQVQRARRSTEVGSLIRSLDPDRAELKKLTDEGMLLRRAISDPIRFGLSTEQVEAAKRAFGDLSTIVKNLVTDIDQFGSRAVAALNRTADFNARNVGATAFGRSAAQINKEFDDKLRDAPERERAGIEDARRKELDTLNRTQSLEMVQRGGAFSRASTDLQAQILAASQRFPTVDPAILAGLLEKEGGFYNTGPTRVLRNGRPATTAWGRGQITDAAEKDIRGIPGMEDFDKYNVDTQVMGAAAYLSLRQRWAGGDMIKALDGYGTGPGYGLNVMRRAGQLGDASSIGVARDLDAQAQAAERSQDALRRNTELYGRNGLALEASTRAADLYRDMLARGVPPSEALRKSLEGYAISAEQASRAARLVQFARDDEFAREQLGRDRIDQQSYAMARARFGDTTSAEARAAIIRTRDTLEMSETKGILMDGATSIVSEFRRTGDAASALSNAFGNAADRLLSKALDTAISGGFNALLGGAGGSGGSAAGVLDFFKSGSDFLKFDGGGYTGPGERYDVAGIVHRGEVVYSAADVARHGGVAAVEAFRRSGGLRGYADGGIVGREAFTMPNAAMMQAANGNAAPGFGNVTINMQGATGDPATDQAHIDATMKALRAEMHSVASATLQRSLGTNGALWKAGVRRAR
ncbi:hypothetical protein D8770_08905 [Methylobacterium sp. DB1607]|nr:hypothetical protein [Methylobacterium sp. DB1607]